MNPGCFSPVLAALPLVAPLVLALAGPALHLYLPRHRDAVEECVKDNEMTDAEARRQMRFYRWSAPILTTLGGALLGAELFSLAN